MALRSAAERLRDRAHRFMGELRRHAQDRRADGSGFLAELAAVGIRALRMNQP